jgi:hypothetical protein
MFKIAHFFKLEMTKSCFFSGCSLFIANWPAPVCGPYFRIYTATRPRQHICAIMGSMAARRAVRDHLSCPISLQVMTEPVMDPEGNTYEKASILAWLARTPISPITRSPLTAAMLTPNRALANAIAQLKPFLEGMEDCAPAQSGPLRVYVPPTRMSTRVLHSHSELEVIEDSEVEALATAPTLAELEVIEDSEVEALARVLCVSQDLAVEVAFAWALSESRDIAVEEEMIKKTLKESKKKPIMRAPPPSFGEAVRMPRGACGFKEDKAWAQFDPAGELEIVEKEMIKKALKESMKEELERKSARAPPPSYDEAVRMPRGLWAFKEDEAWIPFDPAGDLAVETAYAAGQTAAQSQFFNPRLKQAVLYIYDLENMKQLNTATGFVRDIQRRDIQRRT